MSSSTVPGRLAALAAATALALSGCGAGAGTETGQSPPATVAESAEPPEREGSYTAELAVSLLPEPGADPIMYVLACDGTEPTEDSNVPEPAAACELIQKSAEALFFTKEDPTLQCTQQFGGPRTATITGIVDGRSVTGSYSLSNGCEIDRWQTLAPLLGPVGAM